MPNNNLLHEQVSAEEKQRDSFESSLKSSDTEEKIDIWFYRPIGYRIALICRSLGITPNAVTWASIFIGIGAGVAFYFQNIYINILGIFLLIIANTLDSADGQLARLTNNKSLFGRLLDGLAGSFWFITIHIAICLHLQNRGWPAWIWILGIASGLSHMLQSQQADYYRNVYLYFIKGKSGSEQDNSKDLNKKLETLSWKKNFGQKAMYTFYRNYTTQQETFAPYTVTLLRFVRNNYKDALPQWLVDEYRALNKSLMRYTNIIQFNTRTIFLFICILINKEGLYFVFDLVVLNAILIYLCIKEEGNSKKLLKHLNDNS